MNNFLSKLISKGYKEVARGKANVEWFVSGSPAVEMKPKSILIFCPTYVSRGSSSIISESVTHLVQHIEFVKSKMPDVRIILAVGIQWVGNEERKEATDRIKAIFEICHSGKVESAGFVMEGRGKVQSINIAIQYSVKEHIDGFMLVDDDIRLTDASIYHIIDRFYVSQFKGAFGARVRPISKHYRAAKILKSVKSIIKAPVSYPHACCMLIGLHLLKDGIPDRYVSDDGYIAFKLINTTLPDPLRDLTIVEDAMCWYMVGGPFWQSIKRINRILLTHVILLADFPTSTSMYFVRNVIFHGFWPLGKLSLKKRPLINFLRWPLQLIYFVWLCAISIQLITRGMIGHPLKEVKWSAYSEYTVPEKFELKIQN